MARAGDLTGASLIAAYRLLGSTARPAVPTFLRRRVRTGKEDPSRLDERYGRASATALPGDVAWVHAASVGETNTALPLIDRLVAAGWSVVLTTVTRTSAQVAARNLPAGAVHQYAPLDVVAYVRRFLDNWQPRLLVLVETELWPVIVGEAASRGVPVALVNGRLSDRSFRGWSRIRPGARALLADVGLVLAQAERDGERFRALGARNVQVSGNMKFDAPAPYVDGEALQAFRAMAGGRLAWVAASTHDGEEVAAARAHGRIVASGLDPLTVVVPRHPERAGAIRATLEGMALTVAQRSLNEPVGADTAVYLADTLGELGTFYAAASAAFVGGSLAEIGGHNPIEAAKLGVPVVHGPHVHNFSDIYRAFTDSGAALRISGPDELGDGIARLLSSPAEADALARAAAKLVEGGAGALDRTFGGLIDYAAGADHAEGA